MGEVVSTAPRTAEELQKAIAQEEAAFQQTLASMSGSHISSYSGAYAAQEHKKKIDALKAQLAQVRGTPATAQSAVKQAAQVATTATTQKPVDATVDNTTTPATTTQVSTTTATPQATTVQPPLDPLVSMTVSAPDVNGYVEPLAYYGNRTAYGHGAMPTFQQSGLPMNFSTNKFHNNGSDPQLSSWSGLNKSYGQLDPMARMYFDDYARKGMTSNTQMLGAQTNNDIATALSNPQVAHAVQQYLAQGMGYQEALATAMAQYSALSGNTGAFVNLVGVQNPLATQRLNNLVNFALQSGNNLNYYPTGAFGATASAVHNSDGTNGTVTLANGQVMSLPSNYVQAATQNQLQQGNAMNAPSAQTATGSKGSSASTAKDKIALELVKIQGREKLYQQKVAAGTATREDQQQHDFDVKAYDDLLKRGRMEYNQELKHQQSQATNWGS